MFKWYDRIFITISILLIGFAIGITFKLIYNYAAKKPNYWVNPPILVNCIGEELKENTIKRAVEYWEDKGEKILFYQYEPIDSICNSENRYRGIIVIKKGVDLPEATLAQTSIQSSINNIVRADINFREGTYNYILLLEHELGHAFGYKHTYYPEHIMHPYYDYMGDKFW